MTFLERSCQQERRGDERSGVERTEYGLWGGRGGEAGCRGPGVEAGPVQQLFRRFTALILLYFSAFTPTCYCRRAVKSISVLWSGAVVLNCYLVLYATYFWVKIDMHKHMHNKTCRCQRQRICLREGRLSPEWF